MAASGAVSLDELDLKAVKSRQDGQKRRVFPTRASPNQLGTL